MKKQKYIQCRCRCRIRTSKIQIFLSVHSLNGRVYLPNHLDIYTFIVKYIINNDNVETSAYNKTQYKKLLMNVPPSTTINPWLHPLLCPPVLHKHTLQHLRTGTRQHGVAGSPQYSGYIVLVVFISPFTMEIMLCL